MYRLFSIGVILMWVTAMAALIGAYLYLSLFPG